MRNVDCRGNETNLYDCSHKKLEIYKYCSHSEDAGVICPQGVVYVLYASTLQYYCNSFFVTRLIMYACAQNNCLFLESMFDGMYSIQFAVEIYLYANV